MAFPSTKEEPKHGAQQRALKKQISNNNNNNNKTKKKKKLSKLDWLCNRNSVDCPPFSGKCMTSLVSNTWLCYQPLLMHVQDINTHTHTHRDKHTLGRAHSTCRPGPEGDIRLVWVNNAREEQWHVNACPAGTSDRSGGGVDSMVAMESGAITFTPPPLTKWAHTHLQNQGTVVKKKNRYYLFLATDWEHSLYFKTKWTQAALKNLPFECIFFLHGLCLSTQNTWVVTLN